MKEEKESDDKAYMKGEEFGDVITSEYLNWMEDTLKSAGVDIGSARAHFDSMVLTTLLVKSVDEDRKTVLLPLVLFQPSPPVVASNQQVLLDQFQWLRVTSMKGTFPNPTSRMHTKSTRLHLLSKTSETTWKQTFPSDLQRNSQSRSKKQNEAPLMLVDLLKKSSSQLVTSRSALIT
jgi:hypothetical protein